MGVKFIIFMQIFIDTIMASYHSRKQACSHYRLTKNCWWAYVLQSFGRQFVQCLSVQVVGGVAGFALLLALSGASGTAGCTQAAVGAAAGACVEALLTGALALLLCALWAAHDAARPDHTAPLKAGLAIAGLVYAGVSRAPTLYLASTYTYVL